MVYSFLVCCYSAFAIWVALGRLRALESLQGERPLPDAAEISDRLHDELVVASASACGRADWDCHITRHSDGAWVGTAIWPLSPSHGRDDTVEIAQVIVWGESPDEAERALLDAVRRRVRSRRPRNEWCESAPIAEAA